MSKGKVKVRDICLNNSFPTSFFSFYTCVKKKFVFSIKKKKKKKLLHLANFRAGAKTF